MRDFSDAFLDDYLARQGEAACSAPSAATSWKAGRAAVRRDRRRLFRHPRPAADGPAGSAAATRGAGRHEPRSPARPSWPASPASPVTHSLSPLIHNAWIEAAGLDAVYVPFAPPRRRLRRASSRACAAARCAASTSRCRSRRPPWPWPTAPAHARQRRRRGQPAAVRGRRRDRRRQHRRASACSPRFGAQAPGFDVKAGPVVILGAGGAARGAAAALLAAGAPQVRIVNRTPRPGRGRSPAALRPAPAVAGAGRASRVRGRRPGDQRHLRSALAAAHGPTSPFEAAPARRVVHGHGLPAAADRRSSTAAPGRWADAPSTAWRC